MRIEEDLPGRTDQDFVELWFNLPENRRQPLSDSVMQFYRDVAQAANPAMLRGKWNSQLERWTHDIPPVRFTYATRFDDHVGEWIVILDAFYLISVQQ